MRIILYTGKGGVGKTSIAAATALRCSQLGQRTLVMSTDAAHSLGDSLEIALNAEPQPVAADLWAQEVDVAAEIDRHWGTLQRWVATLLSWRGMSEIVAQEMAVLPGMEEMTSLIHLLTYYGSGDYDTVVVDCAPTGETLRLLSLPDILRWWMQRFFPVERTAVRLMRPIARRLTNLPVPDEEVYESIEALYNSLDHMHSILLDSEVSSVRLVVMPEKMVIKEAQRAHTSLNLFGYAIDAVVCNRILPPELDDAFFDIWKSKQEGYLQQVNEAFSPLPVLRAPWQETEVLGLDALSRLASAIYQDQDPSQIYYKGRTQAIKAIDGAYQMTIDLPFIAREDLSVLMLEDELIIQVGNYRRNIILPHSLAGMQVASARHEGSVLRIGFEPINRFGEE